MPNGRAAASNAAHPVTSDNGTGSVKPPSGGHDAGVRMVELMPTLVKTEMAIRRVGGGQRVIEYLGCRNAYIGSYGGDGGRNEK